MRSKQHTTETPATGSGLRQHPLSAALLALLAFVAVLAAAAPALAAPGISVGANVEVEEFEPGAISVGADLYAIASNNTSLPTTVRFQYVDAADYEPGEPDPYVAGTTVALGEFAKGSIEVHRHFSLAPDTTYYYRIVASNSEGTAETGKETLDTHAFSQAALPDGRAYEQVSPADKNHTDAIGNDEQSNMVASSAGSAFAYFSFLPFPQAVGNGGLYTEYMSSRSPTAWSTQGLQAPLEPAEFPANQVVGFTEDLAKAIVEVQGPPLSPPGVTDAYLRDSATGSYQLLVAEAGGELLFAGASRDDSRIFMETQAQLLPAAIAGVQNLYEWDESKPEAQRLSLVGVLPDAECAALSEPPGCAPPGGSGAAPGIGPLQGPGGSPYSQALGAISEDGTRAYFVAAGRIYERLLEAGQTVAVAPGPASFLAATPNGRYVFYAEGEELYRFDSEAESRQALTAGAEGIIGSLGVSVDGSRAYFVAPGVLAANQNANGEEATKGALNLYRWQQGATTFIAQLTGSDRADWRQKKGELFESRSSRLNPAGSALLFRSSARLTGYDNGGQGELFRYDATAAGGEGELACVSCNPSGAVPGYSAYLTRGNPVVQFGPVRGPVWATNLNRNLSADGSRVFFETAEELLPGDLNNVTDVYEWERAGAGSCTESSSAYSAANAGCLFLISSGTAHAPSFFGDASASGNDAFFFTRQPLVGQDTDLNYDIYDARVEGGIAAQSPPAAAPECEAEACKPPASEAPALPGGASQSFQGPAEGPNHPQAPRCAKGQALKHGRCAKKARKKHHVRHERNKGKKHKHRAKHHRKGSVRP